MTETILSVDDLHVGFPVYGGILRHKIGEVRAVDGVSFELRKGETVGLVGESGSGKTTVGRAIINLLRRTDPNVHLGGSIVHESTGTNLNGLRESEMKPFRARVQMIFQDPYSSLNPRMTVRQIIERPLQLHTTLSRSERKAKVENLLDRVGLQAAYAARYPHEFSGGQRQRIGIARALSTEPEIIVADEPVSALDVSVQAQVVNLLEELQEEFNLTYLFIAHDIGIVYHIADRIAVMYLGDIVEEGPAEEVFRNAKHPYTRALLSAVPIADPKGREKRSRIRLEGDIPTPLAKPSGCGFRTRCPIARDACAGDKPSYDREGDHRWACPFAAEIDERAAS